MFSWRVIENTFCWICSMQQLLGRFETQVSSKQVRGARYQAPGVSSVMCQGPGSQGPCVRLQGSGTTSKRQNFHIKSILRLNGNCKTYKHIIYQTSICNACSCTTFVGKNLEKYWWNSSLVKFEVYNMQRY